MYQRKYIDQDGDIVPVLAGTFRFILIDDLQAVVVNILLVDQSDVLYGTVIAFEQLDMVFLDSCGFLKDAVIRTRNAGAEEPFPFRITEMDDIESLQLMTKIRHKTRFRRNGQKLIGLSLQLCDELALQFRLALIRGIAFPIIPQILRYHGALVGDRDWLEVVW